MVKWGYPNLTQVCLTLNSFPSRITMPPLFLSDMPDLMSKTF